MSSSSLEECRWWWVFTWESTNQSGNQGKAEKLHQCPNSCPGRSCPKESQGPAQHHRSALLKDCYGVCLWKCFLLCLAAFLSKTRKMRRTRAVPFLCEGKASTAGSGVTDSPNPPCFSGSSPAASAPQNSPTCPCSRQAALEPEGTQRPWDLGVLSSLGTHLG